MSCIILFPNQLFENMYINKIFKQVNENNNNIILWEHGYYFKDFLYHKLKLAFHRASMKLYFDNIKINKLYIDSIDTEKKQFEKIISFVKKNNITKLLFFNPIEKKMFDLLNSAELLPKNNLEHLIFPSPYFLNSTNFNKNNEIMETLNSTRHNLFYKNQRIKYDIMIKNVNGKIEPDGGIWSFDTENRYPFEKTQKEIEPMNVNIKKDKYINEAIKYINSNYSSHYGLCEKENFIYPISRIDALKWLDDFVKRKLDKFGKYEDAIKSNVVFGYHSVLSPILNIGLITTQDVLNKVEDYKKNIASKEGFIRQIIGWREYCFFIYDKYSKILEKNLFYSKSTKKIPKKIWNGETKIPIIDNIISHINKYAYSHHIERLMCIGNFMLLIGICPKEIYNWFQTMYIDAYDVFMIPNVYGMLLYGYTSDKEHMMTRPYFCSSNYLKKMSDYKSQEIELDNNKYKWDEIIDALYYKLINDYSNEFSKIYSTANAVKRFNSFTSNKKKELIEMANMYIKWIHS